MTNFIINTCRGSASKEIFHKCPFQGKIQVYNFTLNNDKLLSIFPNGRYKMIFHYFNGQGKTLLQVEMEIDLNN